MLHHRYTDFSLDAILALPNSTRDKSFDAFLTLPKH
jgi:hypothetical protein